MILTSHPAPSWDSLTCNLSTGEGGKAQCHHDVSRVVGEGSFQQWWTVTEYIYSSTVHKYKVEELLYFTGFLVTS